MHANILAVSLALAGSALGGALPITRTSILDLYTRASSSTSALTGYKTEYPGPECPVCPPHPKDWDRNWKADETLKDTRKHHSSFKLYAYPNSSNFDFPKSSDFDLERETRLPVHVREHTERKDIWNMQLSFPDPTDKQKQDQPKWNLAKGGLETDGSAPIKDTLFFRLWDPKEKKDTNNWPPHYYREVLTTNSHKKKYEKEGDAKLEAKDGWSLVRDKKDPVAYILTGSKPKGSFWSCPKKDAQPKTLRARAGGEGEHIERPNADDVDTSEFLTEGEFEPPTEEEMRQFKNALRTMFHISEIENTDVVFSGEAMPADCLPIVIKAEEWVNKQ